MNDETRHVVMYSGGIGSWAAAKRVAAEHGTDRLTLLFADTQMEDADTYRFLRESAANVGGELVEIADGRDIWQVFKDARFLGNARIARCSHELKQAVASGWLEENCDPAATVCYVGIDWTEAHRFDRVRDLRAAEGWTYDAPLCDPPYLAKEQLHEWAESEGLAKQRLYQIGAAHANCGGDACGWARAASRDCCVPILVPTRSGSETSRNCGTCSAMWRSCATAWAARRRR